jgi:hypothetical protein
MSQLFWTRSMTICAKLRNLGIEGLKDKINKLKEIEFLQFLNSSIPESLNQIHVKFSCNPVTCKG